MVKTPSDKWREKIVKMRKSCQSISKLSKKIRYVGIVNQYGRTMTGILRSDTKPLLDSEHAKNEFFLASSLLNMRSKPAKLMGALDHVMLQHDKVYVILVQKNDYLYYISVDANINSISGLVSNITKMIKQV